MPGFVCDEVIDELALFGVVDDEMALRSAGVAGNEGGFCLSMQARLGPELNRKAGYSVDLGQDFLCFWVEGESSPVTLIALDSRCEALLLLASILYHE